MGLSQVSLAALLDEGPVEHSFGDWVGQGPGFEVTNGRFADWPVAAAADGAQGWRGLYGGLRGPMSMNRSPNATRNGGTMCGVPVGVGNASWWAACLEPDDVRDMHLCIDYEVHGMAHFGVGGGWPRYAHQPPATGNISGNAAPLCASFYGMVGSRGEDRQLGSYVYPVNAGCFACPDCAADELPLKKCVCGCAREHCACEGVWTGNVYLTANNTPIPVDGANPAGPTALVTASCTLAYRKCAS